MGFLLSYFSLTTRLAIPLSQIKKSFSNNLQLSIPYDVPFVTSQTWAISEIVTSVIREIASGNCPLALCKHHKNSNHDPNSQTAEHVNAYTHYTGCHKPNAWTLTKFNLATTPTSPLKLELRTMSNVVVFFK